MMWARTIADERGISLLITMIFVAVLSGLAILGLSLAHGELETSVRNTSRTAAFYAADLGLALTLENWAGARAASTQPGQTRVIRQDTLPGGHSFTAVVQRLDDGSTVHPLYVLRVAASRGSYENQVGLLVTSVPLEIPIDFALRVRGETKLRGNTEVNGNDHVPPDIAAECPPAEASRPGIVTNDEDNLNIGGSAEVDGDPPIEVDPAIDDASFFDFGGMTYDELAAKANIVLPGNTHISTGPSPTLDGEGACDVSDPYNWGDPTNLGQPCTTWFPIIHVTGNLKLSSHGHGQGILLVDGDLEMTGGVEFYGPVIAKGKLKSTGGGFHVHGGLIAGATDLDDQSFLAGNSAVVFSSCALRRAVSHSDVSEARPLTERPWFQVR